MTRSALQIKCEILRKVLFHRICFSNFNAYFSRCEAPKCVGRCTSDSDCGKVKGHFCQNGHCLNKCSSKRDCPIKEGGYRAVCARDKCYYMKTGCDSNDDCSNGRYCYQKRCIKSKCASHKQCQELTGKEGYLCIKGKCIKANTCRSHEYCSKKHGDGYRCVKGKCAKVL